MSSAFVNPPLLTTRSRRAPMGWSQLLDLGLPGKRRLKGLVECDKYKGNELSPTERRNSSTMPIELLGTGPIVPGTVQQRKHRSVGEFVIGRLVIILTKVSFLHEAEFFEHPA